MTDNRPVATIVDEQRKAALVARLTVNDGPALADFAGVSILTARDIEEVFASEYEADYANKAEVCTPAYLLVDVTCLNCHNVIPDVHATLSSKTTIEKEGVGKVQLRLKADAMIHTCGQMSFPRPVGPEVEGQTGMDDIDEPGAEGEGDE